MSVTSHRFELVGKEPYLGSTIIIESLYWLRGPIEISKIKFLKTYSFDDCKR